VDGFVRDTRRMPPQRVKALMEYYYYYYSTAQDPVMIAFYDRPYLLVADIWHEG
jgi:hypothetical protein